MSRTLSGLIAGDTDLTVNVNLENISAGNVVSGIFAVERIPDLSATKITGTLTTAQIPTLPVSKVSFLNSDVNLGSGGLVVDDVNAVDIVLLERHLDGRPEREWRIQDRPHSNIVVCHLRRL